MNKKPTINNLPSISDEELILYFYQDELDHNRQTEIATAVKKHPEIAQRYARLEAELGGLREQPAVNAPETATQRWLQALDDFANPQVTPKADPMQPWYTSFFNSIQTYLLPAGAFASVLAVGIMLGIFWSGMPEAPLTSNYNTFAQGVRSHLQATSQQLISLNINDAAQRQELIDEIIAQNRLFALAAAGNDADDLARVLRAFEPILKSLADTRTTPMDAIAAREQLTFELEVMQTKIANAASKPASNTQKRTTDV